MNNLKKETINSICKNYIANTNTSCNVSRIFNNMEDGSLYCLKIINKNYYIEFIETNKQEALIEFLNNYINRHPKLSIKTKTKIYSSIQLLKNQINTNISFFESHKEKQISTKDDLLYFGENMNETIKYVLKVTIFNVDRYAYLSNFKISHGRVSGWFKNDNDLRVIYSFLDKNINELINLLQDYNLDDISAFFEKTKHRVENCDRFSNEIKELYLLKLTNVKKSILGDLKLKNLSDDKYDKLINFITKNKEAWAVYCSENSTKILDTLYNNTNILKNVLELIEN